MSPKTSFDAAVHAIIGDVLLIDEMKRIDLRIDTLPQMLERIDALEASEREAATKRLAEVRAKCGLSPDAEHAIRLLTTVGNGVAHVDPWEDARAAGRPFADMLQEKLAAILPTAVKTPRARAPIPVPLDAGRALVACVCAYFDDH